MIQTAFPGDLVLTLPLLRRLAARHGPVDLVATPTAGPLVAGHPSIRQIHLYDKRGRDRGTGGLFRLARRLRRLAYARAYLPHRSLRSALLASLSGAADRIGFGGRLSGWLLTRRIVWPPDGHESDRLLALAGDAPDGNGTVTSDWLALTPAEVEAAGAWLAAGGITGRFVVLAPGSRWGSKRWPYFRELAAALPCPVVAIGGPEDREPGAAVAAAAGRGVNGAGVLSLRAAGAVVARAALVVTNDSLPLHLASATGRPALALFGPTVPAFGFGPLTPGSEILERHGLACRPCSPHGPPSCPLGHHRCLREITVEEVAATVRTCLDRE